MSATLPPDFNYEPFNRMAVAAKATLKAAELQASGVKTGCPKENFFPVMLGCIARTDPEVAERILSIFELALLDHAEDMNLMSSLEFSTTPDVITTGRSTGRQQR